MWGVFNLQYADDFEGSVGGPSGITGSNIFLLVLMIRLITMITKQLRMAFLRLTPFHVPPIMTMK